MNITFDSNVWEKTVVAEPSKNDKYYQLQVLIREGTIKAYICEIAVSLESIMKKDRATFWFNYEPKSEHENVSAKINSDGTTTIHNRVMFGPDNEKHPGLHSKLIRNLELAKQLDFRVLRMTNIGTVRTNQIPKEMLCAFDSRDDFWDYAEKVSSCAEYIGEIKCGSFEYHQFKQVNNLQNIPVVRALEILDDSKRKTFAKTIAEWVDGDSIAAHYAHGNDFFCTEDRGRAAGSKSVFSSVNLSRVKEKYNIEVLSVDEVLAAMTIGR